MSDFSRLVFLVETVFLAVGRRLAGRVRNRMVHEYVRNPAELAEALNEGHAFVPLLADFGDSVARFGEKRGMLPPSISASRT